MEKPASRWSHEVVVLMPPRPRSGRSPAAVEAIGPALQALLDDGRAEPVFQANFQPNFQLDLQPVRKSDRQAKAVSLVLPKVYTVKTLGEAQTREVLETLSDDMGAATVYVAPPRGVLARSPGADMGAQSSSMSHWGMQYVAVDADAVDASDIAVAVVDTGVDRAHPDLVNAIDAYVNFCQDESEDDVQGHGTHVCGIIAATGQPPGGMKGACNARLHVFKGIGVKYSATDYYRALGAALARAKIVNLSLGGPDHDPAEELIIQQGLNSGALVIAASGNDGDDGDYPNYPANLPGVLAVGAIDDQGARADFSNAGPHLSLVAPGVDIWSTAPTKASSLFKKKSGYAPCSGTSMATPFVTAMAARVAAGHPGPSPAATIRDNIPIDRCPGQTGKTDDLGYGCVHWKGPFVLSNA